MSLKDELTNDPLGRGYSSMTDEQIVTSLTTKDRPGPFPANVIPKVLSFLGRIDAAERAAVGLAIYDEVNLTDVQTVTAITNHLDDYIAKGQADESVKTAILALGENRRTRAEEIGLIKLNEGDVKAARAS